MVTSSPDSIAGLPALPFGLIDAVADNADLLIRGDDAGLQNRLHLALEAKGFGVVKRVGEK